MDLATLTYISTLLTILSVVVGCIGYVRGWWESPERKEERDRQKAMADALLGEAVVRDRQGKIIDPGKPGLVARTVGLEEAVATLVNQDARIKAVEAKTSEHDTAIAAIIAHTFDSGARSALEAERLRAQNTGSDGGT